MRKAYFLLEAMIAVVIAGVVLTVFTTMNYYTNIQSNTLKQANTKIILEVDRSRLIGLAQDPDGDSYFELLKEDTNNTLPIDVGLGTDAWGNRIYYYTIDLGNPNVDPTYADTNTSISPNANIAGRLVSAGENMSLETSSTDSVAQGDDLMLEIGVGELNHFKLYGGSEITTQTRGYNSAIVSTTAPSTPIGGTMWYDTSALKLKIYDSNTSSWIIIP
jgi:hypothetical protein